MREGRAWKSHSGARADKEFQRLLGIADQSLTNCQHCRSMIGVWVKIKPSRNRWFGFHLPILELRSQVQLGRPPDPGLPGLAQRALEAFPMDPSLEPSFQLLFFYGKICKMQRRGRAQARRRRRRRMRGSIPNHLWTSLLCLGYFVFLLSTSLDLGFISKASAERSSSSHP